MSVLESNPQRGTAFDFVYGYHVQGGTLDGYVSSLVQRTTKNESDGAAWMILGLIESQRRNEQQAIHAFTHAQRLRADDANPPFYRGQLLYRLGEYNEAIIALDQAVQRKPNRALLVQIIEQLGRCYERLHQSDAAIKTWTRLEEQFPNDLRILERIAMIQQQEGSIQAALEQYDRMAKLAIDGYQRTEYRLKAAMLRIKLGKKDSALVELESILSELNPDAWIFIDAQKKLESVFLQSKDLDGLIKYYEKRLAKDPKDLVSMIRLSKHLQSSSRNEDARQWIHRAIGLAPSRTDLRKSLIDLLVADKQWSAAAQQYQRLAEVDPKNVDTLRAWGSLVLRDPSLNSDEAKQTALRIWQRMIDVQPTDAALQVQVADLLMAAGMPEPAQKLFERAVELQADNPQYLEYLGSLHFSQKRREKAFETWESMTAGKFRSAESFLRLAEIYQRVDLNRAADRASQACLLAPNDRSVRLRAADIQRQAGRMDDALANITVAEKLSEGQSEREIAIAQRLNVLEESHRLAKETEKLSRELELKADSDPNQWQLLARYLMRLGKWKDAEEAAVKAIGIDPNSIASLQLLVEITDSLGNLPQSIATLKQLTDLDGKRRAEYLGKIAKLQVRGGDKSEAISSAKQLVQAHPSSVDGFLLLANIYSQSKEGDLAIETLRKALRLEPRSKAVNNALCDAFINQQKYQEAIELYWQCFERSESLDERLEIVAKLVVPYSRQGKTGALIDILENDRKDVDVHSELTQCLARVYSANSDFANASKLLAELLPTNPDDPKLLEQLASACIASKDLGSAVKYQRQLVAIQPDGMHEAQLATLLSAIGDYEGAHDIEIRLLQNEPSPVVLVKTLDEWMVRGEYPLVKQTAESILKKEPANWELIYRLAVAYVEMDQMQDALALFERTVEMPVHREDSSYQGLRQRDSLNAEPVGLATELELICLPALMSIAQGQFGKPANRAWTPKTFGELRLASLAWLAYVHEMGAPSRLVLAHRSNHDQKQLSRQALLDALALARFQMESKACLEIMELLADRGERAQGSLATAVYRPSTTTNLKPRVQLDPRVKELNRLEVATDKLALVNYARAILLKPDELLVPSRPLILHYKSTRGAPSPMVTNSGSKTNRDPARGEALKILRREGELERLCDDVEQRIQRSPNSFLLHSLWVECLEALGHIDAADKALRETVRIRPTASETRLYWVDLLYRHSRYDAAASQFLELLRSDPELALCEISHYPDMFERSENASNVIGLIQQSDLSSKVLSRAYMLSGVILAKSPNCFEVGAAILERLFEFHPLDGLEALDHLYLTIATDFPRMLNFTAKALIPIDRNALRSVWYGYYDRQFLSKRDDLLSAILGVHPADVISRELRDPIAAAVDRMPDWLGGKLMLATILAHQQIDHRALAVLNDLAISSEVGSDHPDAAAKCLAMELGRFPQHQSRAIQMLTALAAKPGSAINGHDVKVALAKIWVQRGNREKALETLTSSGPSSFRSRRDFMRGLGVSYDEAELFAHDTLSIGLPIESFVYHSHPYFPRRKFGPTREEGIAAAIRMVESMPADKAIEELLFDRTKLDLQNSALELLFEPPALRQVAKQPMECVLHRELMRHTRSGKSNEIAKAFDDLAQKHPDDLAVSLARTRWMLETGIGDSERAIQELDQRLSFQKDTVNQPHVYSVWFIARRCYQLKRHIALADRFAAQALTAAHHLDNVQITITTNDKDASFDQPRRENASSLLLEWGKSLLQIGEVDKGMAMWKQMVQQASKFHRSPTEWIDVVEQWGVETGRADKCVNLLLPIFTGKSIQIYPMSNESELLSNRANSVAAILVRLARQSHRLKELVALTEANQSDDIHYLVLRTQIAIAEKDFEVAQSMLKMIATKSQPMYSRGDLETACHAAIPAFENPQLQPEARAILSEFLHRMESESNYRAEDFDGLPLVRKIRGD